MDFLKNNIVAILGLGLFAMFISKTSTDAIVEALARQEELEESEIRQTDGATIGKYKARELYKRLYNAMNYFWGTHEDRIYAVFREIKNQADYNMVYNEFALEQRSNTTGDVGDPFTSDRYDLTHWLTDELEDKEIAIIREIHPNIVL